MALLPDNLVVLITGNSTWEYHEQIILQRDTDLPVLLHIIKAPCGTWYIVTLSSSDICTRFTHVS